MGQLDFQPLRRLVRSTSKLTSATNMESNSRDWPDVKKNPEAEEFRKLFVGGLCDKSNEDTLKEYFQSYGAVETCDIVKEKNNQNKGVYLHHLQEPQESGRDPEESSP